MTILRSTITKPVLSAVQVISIATLASTTGMGGFFPDGLNGPINGARLLHVMRDGSHARNSCFLSLTLTLNHCSALHLHEGPQSQSADFG
jgi:hypothetical protein